MPYRNAPIHPFLRFLYSLFKLLSRVFVGLFFREKVLIGKEHLRFDGPAIIVVNHPSTLMDVLAPGIHVRQVMYFLANYSLFKHPVSNWLLSRLYCIPVKRREDVSEGELRDNGAAFEKSYEHLEKNGVLFIAAEGVSWMNKFVRPFKTGTARIAFGTENQNGWAKGVVVVPIGLSYTAPNLFRTRVVVEAGKPLEAVPWKDAWIAQPEKTVDDFTLAIENTVRNLCIDTRDEAGESLFDRMQTIAAGSQPLNPADDYLRSKKIAQTCLHDAPLNEQSAAYFAELEKYGITDAGLLAATRPNARRHAWRDGSFLALGLPLFLLGNVFWFLPCFLPWLLNKKMNLYIGYGSTVKVLAGLFTFPLAAWGVFKLAFAFSGTAAWCVLAGLILLGPFLESYLDVCRRFAERRKARLPRPVSEALVNHRTALWNRLQSVTNAS